MPRNYVERRLALREVGPVYPGPGGDAEPTFEPAMPLPSARERWMRVFERRSLQAFPQHHGENVTAVARTARGHRAQMYRLPWRNGLR